MMKKRTILTALYVAAACILCGGCGGKEPGILIGNMSQPAQESTLPENTQESTADSPESEEAKQDEVIRVYVCGAVVSPGVVEIPAGSRAEEALAAAGGFAAEAAREAVNLADWVNDGQKLYFPALGEEVQTEAAEPDEASGLVNINTADVAALCTLPGVGEAKAADIIAWREANGGFECCEDIMKVSGIKTAMYEKIRDKITVGK